MLSQTCEMLEEKWEEIWYGKKNGSRSSKTKIPMEQAFALEELFSLKFNASHFLGNRYHLLK